MEHSRDIEFEWDDNKARRNARRHGIQFEEAKTAFDDAFACIIGDETHSFDEPRELLIGYSGRQRLLFVVFTQRAPNVIRIISARRASGQEQKRYEQEKRF